MAVRQATVDDVDSILDLLEGMASTYGKDKLIRDRAEVIVQSSCALGLCYVSEKQGCVLGTIVGLVQEHPFLDLLVLQEVAWYSLSGEGTKLLIAFLKRGEQIGVNAITASTLISNPGADKVMRTVGFESTETAWIKRI